MFGWLAKMLMMTPVQTSGCPCCEGKRQRLEKMRHEIANGELDSERAQPILSSLSFCSGHCSIHYRADGSCFQNYSAEETIESVETTESCCCGKCR